MTNKTKNALYSLLDLIDSIGTISFVNLDVESVNSIKKEVISLINNDGNSNITPNVLNSTNAELLGILPTILLDETKFPSPKDILIFAERCLMIEVKPYWTKRSRAELVGTIIAEVSKQNANQLNRFLDAWDSFNKKSDNQSIDKNKHIDFVNMWLNFFDNYKRNE